MMGGQVDDNLINPFAAAPAAAAAPPPAAVAPVAAAAAAAAAAPGPASAGGGNPFGNPFSAGPGPAPAQAPPPQQAPLQQQQRAPAASNFNRQAQYPVAKPVFLKGESCVSKLTPAWAKKEACLGITIGQIVCWGILLGVPYLISLGLFITNMVTATGGKPYIYVDGHTYGPCALLDASAAATAGNIGPGDGAACPASAAAKCQAESNPTALHACVVATNGVMNLYGVTPRTLGGLSGILAAPFIYPANAASPFTAIAVFILSTSIFLINGFLLLQRSFWAFASCWIFCQVVGEGIIWLAGFPSTTIFLAGILGNAFTWCSITAIVFEYLATRQTKCRTLVVSIIAGVLWCAYIGTLIYGALTSNASLSNFSSGIKRDWCVFFSSLLFSSRAFRSCSRSHPPILSSHPLPSLLFFLFFLSSLLFSSLLFFT